MADWVDRLSEFLVLSSLQLLVLGMVAGGIVALARVRGRAAYWMFGLVLLLPLLFPVGPFLPMNIPVALPPAGVDSEPVEVGDSNAGYVSAEKAIFLPDEPRSESAAAVPAAPSDPEPPQRLPVFRVPDWKSLFVCLWLAGVAVLFARLLWGMWRVRGTLRRSSDVLNPEVLTLVRECAGQIGLRALPRLAVGEDLGVPVAIGFFRPTVLVPGHLVHMEHREGLRFTLLHEMAHLKRLDSWWLLLELLLKAVYFFHPVVHWVLRKIREEREILCDFQVTQITKAKASYAEFLLKQIWISGNGKGRAFAVPFGEKRSSVARRVRHILSDRRQDMFGKIRDGMAIGLVVIVGATLLSLSPGPAQSGGGEEKTAKSENYNGVLWESVFVFDTPIQPGDVWVEIDRKKMKEGEDYTVDYQNGKVIVTNPAIKRPQAEYLVQAGNRAFGNTSGIPRNRNIADSTDYDPNVDYSQSVVIKPRATSDRTVYPLYRLLQTRGLLVCIGKQGDPNYLRWLKRDRDYIYSEETAQITLLENMVPLKEETGEYVLVEGIPRRDLFLFKIGPIKPGNVRVVVNGQEMKEGKDYFVDYQNGRVHVTNPVILEKDADYQVTVGHWLIGHAQAHESHRELLPARRGLAFSACEDYDPTIPEELFIEESPPPYRDNPMVYRVRLYSKGFMLGVCDRSLGVDVLQWLKKDRDYTYNEDTGEIRLLGEKWPFQQDKRLYLLAKGVPRRDLFQFHGTLEKGSVQVIVNGRMLTEGEGYVVDYENRCVRILDPAVNDYRVRYKVSGPGQEYIDRWTVDENTPREVDPGAGGPPSSETPNSKPDSSTPGAPEGAGRSAD